MTKRSPIVFRYFLIVANRNKYPVVNSNFAFRLKNMATANGTEKVTPNQLVHSRSPYLLQHATNPVDWYPWGQVAIEKAKAENKVIFLSVGYSTCHWCHVMEKESFENEDIAKIMNKHFINIKVDREERPDIDKIYMTYIQATTGSGGWPMSVWLTPNLTPIYGGTYYPPEDTHYNRPGFRTILLGISKQWADDKFKLERSGKLMIDAMTREMASSEKGISIPASSFVYKAFHQLSHSYDPQHGGFGKAPKFPQSVNLKFLLHFYHSKLETSEGQLALDMVVNTLRMIAHGGIHDHISYGMHRYSTDDEWHVPHFEKMLYDQAQLAEIYTEAYQITRDPLFMEMAKDILLYVSKNLRDKSGGFYSAEDADSLPADDSKHKQEGAFCVWKKDDVMRLLDKPIEGVESVRLCDVFCEYYNIKDNGNVNPYQDPHGELKGENVLIVKKSKENVAEQFGIDVDLVDNLLESGRKILREERLKRPKPHLDDKMIAAWNGLMTLAFAKAGQVFNEDTYINKATQAAAFIEGNLYEKATKKLLRSAYRDVKGNVVQTDPTIYAFADDYAFVIQGLINLFEACGDVKWLDLALELQDRQDDLFWDDEEGVYYQTDGKDSTVLLRLKDDQDGAQPSSNSVSALNLLKLSEIFTDEIMKQKALKIFKAFSLQLKSLPLSLPLMLCGLMMSESNWKRIVIKGGRNDERTKALVEAVHSTFIPNKITILVDSDIAQPTHKKIAVLDHLKAVSGQSTAFVCEGKACSLPVTIPEKLKNFMWGNDE